MKVLMPIFYDDFKCSADKCTYTCCRDWGILVDKNTYQRYEELGLTVRYQEHFMEDSHGNKKMRLLNGKCPFLNEQGLCKLVIEYGENILCHTCETFPRQTFVRKGVLELGLSNACPEVLRYLNSIKPPLSFFEDEVDMNLNDTIISELVIRYRDSAIDILQLQEFPLWARLYILYMYSKRINVKNEIETNYYIEQYTTMKYLNETYQQLIKLDNPLDYKIPATFELFFGFSSKIPKDIVDIRYIVPILEYVSKVEMDMLIESWECFEEYFRYSYNYFENFCVNYMFVKSIRGENELKERIEVLLLEIALIRFALFLQWQKNAYRLSEEDIIGISCYYARIIEHRSLQQIIKIVEEIGEGEWFQPGNLFALIR